jgi:hypothetical protein
LFASPAQLSLLLLLTRSWVENEGKQAGDGVREAHKGDGEARAWKGTKNGLGWVPQMRARGPRTHGVWGGGQQSFRKTVPSPPAIYSVCLLGLGEGLPKLANDKETCCELQEY